MFVYLVGLLLLARGACSTDHGVAAPNHTGPDANADGLVLTRRHYEALADLCESAKLHLDGLDHGVTTDDDPVLLELVQFVSFEEIECGRLLARLENALFESINQRDQQSRSGFLRGLFTRLNINENVQSDIIENCAKAIAGDLRSLASVSAEAVSEYLSNVIRGAALHQKHVLSTALTEDIPIERDALHNLLTAAPADRFPSLVSEFVLSRDRYSLPIDWAVLETVICRYLQLPASQHKLMERIFSHLDSQVRCFDMTQNPGDRANVTSLFILVSIYARSDPNCRLRLCNYPLYELIEAILNPGLNDVRHEILLEVFPHWKFVSRNTQSVGLVCSIYSLLTSEQALSLPETERCILATIMLEQFYDWSSSCLQLDTHLKGVAQLLNLNVETVKLDKFGLPYTALTQFNIALQLHEYFRSDTAKPFWPNSGELAKLCFKVVRPMSRYEFYEDFLGKNVLNELLNLPLDLSDPGISFELRGNIRWAPYQHRSFCFQVLWEHYVKSDATKRAWLLDLFEFLLQDDSSAMHSYASTINCCIAEWGREGRHDLLPACTYPLVFDILRSYNPHFSEDILRSNPIQQEAIFVLLRLSLDFADDTHREMVRWVIQNEQFQCDRTAPNADSTLSLLWSYWLRSGAALDDWFVGTFAILKRRIGAEFDHCVERHFVDWTSESPSEWFPAKVVPTALEWIRTIEFVDFNQSRLPIALLRMPLDFMQASHRDSFEKTLRKFGHLTDEHGDDSARGLLLKHSVTVDDDLREWFDRMLEIVDSPPESVVQAVEESRNSSRQESLDDVVVEPIAEDLPPSVHGSVPDSDSSRNVLTVSDPGLETSSAEHQSKPSPKSSGLPWWAIVVCCAIAVASGILVVAFLVHRRRYRRESQSVKSIV